MQSSVQLSRKPQRGLFFLGYWIHKLRGNLVIKNSLYNLIAFGAPFVFLLGFTPLLIHYMGPENYGLWTLAISTLGFMGVFEFGLETTIAKHVAEYVAKGEIENLSSTVVTGYLYCLVAGILLTAPIYLLAPQIASFFQGDSFSAEEITFVIRLVSLGLIPTLLRNASLAIPKGLQRYKTVVLFEITQNALLLITTLLITLGGGSITQIVIGTLITIYISVLLGTVWAFRLLQNMGAYFYFSYAQARKLFTYTALVAVGGIGQRLFNSMDRLVVGAMLDFSSVTYYTIAVGVANKLLALSGTATRALLPAASSWHATGQVEMLQRYLWRATLLVFVVSTILAGCLLVYAEPILRLWLQEAYAPALLQPFRILVLIYALLAVCAPSFQIASGMGIVWLTSGCSIVGGLATIALVWLWSDMAGLKGAAWANLGYGINFILPFYTFMVIRRLKLAGLPAQ